MDFKIKKRRKYTLGFLGVVIFSFVLFKLNDTQNELTSLDTLDRSIASSPIKSHRYFLGDEPLDLKFNESYEGGSAEEEYLRVNKVFADAVDALKVAYPLKTDKVLRDAHAKSHGCVTGEFTVMNEKIPESLRVGLFKENKTYSTWIRFSNNHSDAKRHDQIKDLRGMSLKLMGVEGKKILPDEQNEKTQDLLMFGSPIFFLKNSKDYKIFLDFINKGLPSALLDATTRLGSIPALISGFLDVQKRLDKIAKISNPLDIPYFSSTPYRLGDLSQKDRSAIKFGIKRVVCEKENFAVIPADIENLNTPNYLRDSLRESLRIQDACFEFGVQFYDESKDLKKEAIEDPRIEWTNSWNKVAFLRIKKQEFDFEEQNKFCENLSFTPWHALTTHRPLGRTNRVRGILYHVINRYRHDRNHAPRKEPSDFNIK